MAGKAKGGSGAPPLHETDNKAARAPLPHSSSKPKLVRTPLAIPAPLEEWVREEAAKLGMNRNAFLNFTLNLARQTQTIERLRRVETRLAALENWRATVG